ncbi:hypothetical protein DFJ73DRAFT_796057 [Zopfochytrium polystomum]|nr:hypothetical protein DFJ73DRAFT_796057 [Zopfochytrium polystomum]
MTPSGWFPYYLLYRYKSFHRSPRDGCFSICPAFHFLSVFSFCGASKGTVLSDSLFLALLRAVLGVFGRMQLSIIAVMT